LEYVGGATPTAYFFDEAGNEIDSITLGDFDLNEVTEALKSKGFVLKRANQEMPTELITEVSMGNNHYQVFRGSTNYEDAKVFAESRTHNGQSGRLLEIYCKEQENKIIDWLKLADVDSVIWLGATEISEEGTWKWTSNNEPFFNLGDPTISKYHNWRPSEPNNANNDENCASLTYEGWNDVNCMVSTATVVVEFGPTSSEYCSPLHLEGVERAEL